jgi:phosphoglycerol transferase MdoB-like AlkP superfamily enzyme
MLLGRGSDGPAKPVFRWLVRLIAVSAAVLIPWAAYLALSLPASVSARHWPAAWTGLDVMMAAGLAVTAWLAVRRDRRMVFPAVATATLLLVDAWFDVCTAPAGSPLVMALADMCVEIAEAAGCLALTVAVWRTAPGEPVSPGHAQ